MNDSTREDVAPIAKVVLRGLSETWRFLRFFAVGVAWSAPLLLAVAVNDNPGVAAHPRLAQAVHVVQGALLVAAPVVAVLGIIVVAVLSERAPKLDAASATPVLVFALIAVASYLILTDRIAAPLWLLPVAVVLPYPLLTLIGAAVTAWRLASWRKTAAAVWLVMWLLTASATWFAGQRAPGMEDDLAAGLVLVIVGSVVFGVTLAASIFAFGATTIFASGPDGGERGLTS